MDYKAYIDLLKSEMVIAMGCTEPLALAYAGSLARYVLGEDPSYVELTCSSNIIKNVRCVHVPNSEEFNGIKAYVFENKNEIVFSKNNIKSITTNKLYF